MQRITTLTLTAIAGYIDTLTYVCAGTLFAAHVTGNFVVFGASLANGIEPRDYFKLGAFPVFVLAVAFGAMIFGISNKQKWRLAEMKLVLALQAAIFMAVATAGFFAPNISASWLAIALVMAMGLQNSLHRYIPGPMTTVMTGSVMNWSAARAERFLRLPPPEIKTATGKPLTGGMIVAFAIGCIAGGFAAPSFGLSACLLPGLLIPALIFLESKKENSAP